MVSQSSNIFQNDINSIIILIFIINMLPNMIENYLGPQFIKAAKNNDMIRNFCIFLGILVLVELSDIEEKYCFCFVNDIFYVIVIFQTNFMV